MSFQFRQSYDKSTFAEPNFKFLKKKPPIAPLLGKSGYICPKAFEMPPAARITDMHVCPMVTPGTPPIPHVGGPVIGPGSPTVLIGGMPAAVMGDQCVCVGPPDVIIKGSATVLIGGKPAARMGDSTAHGGQVLGCIPTVMIGG